MLKANMTLRNQILMCYYFFKSHSYQIYRL